MWVALTQPAEGLNRTKKLTLSLRVRENSSCLAAFEPGHQLFPAFGLKLKNHPTLCLKAVSLEQEPRHWISWVSGLWTQIGTETAALLGDQPSDCKSWGSSASEIT